MDPESVRAVSSKSPQHPLLRRSLPGLIVALAILWLAAVPPVTFGQAPAAAAPATTPIAPVTSPNSATRPASTSGTSATNGQRNTQATDRNQGRTPSDQLDQRSVFRPPPTEFQRMVEETTGTLLPIFGASLFENVPSTFAPVDNIPVTPDYAVGPGDELLLQIWGQVNQQGSYIVDRTGAISIPQLGTVHVAGVHFADLRSFLQGQFGRVYRNFDLNVNMGQLRSIQVFVVGQAQRPGSYTIGSLSTLLNALFESGGPLPQGSLRDIQVRRGGSTIVHFDLYDLLLHGDKSKDVPLQPGDVIFIPPVGPQVAVAGSVNNPAVYELRNEKTIDQLLALGGGRNTVAAESLIRLERIDQHTVRSIVDINAQTVPAISLRNGDILSISSIVDRFKDAVTLRGNVANPGRYVWHQGMRVNDLFPDREALITRNYWRKRNQLAQGPIEVTPASPTEGALQIQSDAPAASATRPAAQPERTSKSSDAGGSSVGVALTGSNTLFDAKTDVILSAPDIDWSYAVIERQSQPDLKTTLLSFNLGKVVLNHDQSQNLELLPGDVVTIFSTADLRVPSSQQTRLVRLEGEFVGAGIYSVLPGETLRQLLIRAGGFTPDAYLFGSEFSRQSTRRLEQQRLREYADQLEAQVSTVTASSNARAVSDRDAAANDASASDARAAIQRLRQMQPVGRIVLQLKPDSTGVESVPDLALEDGDRFVVPRVPSSVNVEGQVYSANAFLYEQGKHSRDYLRLAGGPDRQADKKRSFILRADGSVISRQYAKIDHATIFPGDTIVVPPVISRRAILRNIVDISSIIGSVGFAAAAISAIAIR